MFRLLNIEVHKLHHNRSSKILILIYFLLLTSTALIATVNFNFIDIPFHLAEMGVFNFPYIWHLNTFISATIKFFLLLVIVSMMANEYSNKTLKQNLIDGLSKKEFILSKFYTVVALAAISTLFVFFVSLILGLIYSDFNEMSIILTDLEYILAYFVKLVGFFSFGLFLGILIKRSAFAVAGFIIWFLVEFFSYLKFSVHDNLNVEDTFFQFTPLGSMWNLIDEPFTRFSAIKSLANKVGGELDFNYAVHWYEIVIVLGWTFIFMYLSYKLLKSRDL